MSIFGQPMSGSGQRTPRTPSVHPTAPGGTMTLVYLLAPLAFAADPADGSKPGAAYQSWLSPMQEGGEESETPGPLKATLGSTAPSTPRDQRKSRGYGVLTFTNDLSRAYVDVQIEGV